MQFLSDLADLAVILPAFLALSLTLLASGWRRGAVSWTLVVGGTLGVVFLAQLAARLMPDGPGGGGAGSPSGHVASAAILYGGLAVLLMRRRLLALVLALACAAAMATSQLVLHVHSLPAVLAGGALGLAGVVALARLAPAAPVPPGGLRMVLPAVLASVVLPMHGTRLTAEGLILRIASELSRLLEG
ncbi:phosphatase PAP2 family protein [Teichococcus oryzae]|uniref:Phosphatase PAP2 family protein n=1 Tax=Teichococcus oryzae TaxID=1608942 RepID=A0A5B2TF18_9PROT|nr:phosphatase PAP2 family protein [Pseudoroseomonas oryzae]KAA2212488.1 phosphatase PAP2 family protein [Pseudoroseomonas oryzae]